jgi:hypothetical protein
MTDEVSGRVATYWVRPRRQDPPTARFALDVAGTRYTGDGKGWLLAGTGGILGRIWRCPAAVLNGV